MSPKKMIRLLEKMMDAGSPAQFMRNQEKKRGFTVIMPGDVSWLPKEDWIEDVVISRNNFEIRLVAIIAIEPNSGAFTRMINAIIKDGLVPVVITPTREMRATLTRWNWQKRYVGWGDNREEHWQPRDEFLLNRRTLAFMEPEDA